MEHLDRSNDIGESLNFFYSLTLIGITKANVKKSSQELEKIAESYKDMSLTWLEISKGNNL